MKHNRDQIIYKYDEDEYPENSPSVSAPFNENGSADEFPIPKLPIWRAWLLIKWVIAPFVVAVTLVALGLHLGATGADAWYTRSVLWIISFLFGKKLPIE